MTLLNKSNSGAADRSYSSNSTTSPTLHLSVDVVGPCNSRGGESAPHRLAPWAPLRSFVPLRGFLFWPSWLTPFFRQPVPSPPTCREPRSITRLLQWRTPVGRIEVAVAVNVDKDRVGEGERPVVFEGLFPGRLGRGDHQNPAILLAIHHQLGVELPGLFLFFRGRHRIGLDHFAVSDNFQGLNRQPREPIAVEF